MRSPDRAAAALVRKEWRALWAAPGWWVLLAAIGPLVGVSFARAVLLFSEVSAGAATGGGEAFSPLDGIWAPAFSGYEVAAVFLLPFVAIRMVGGDRQSGALKIELQRSLPAWVRTGAKAIVLITAWMITGLAAVIAIGLWASYGGSVYGPELAALWCGHLLNGGLSIALAMAAASMTDHPATAAIAALGVTVGTWVLAFAGIMQGGIWERLAGYTPTALVAMFQHGLVRFDVTAIAVIVIAAGLGLAAVWTPLGLPGATRARETAIVVIVAAVAIGAAGFAPASWSVDASENRRNSFPEADEAALAALPVPVHIEVHLAPQDPRRVDLDRRALAKLRRVRPDTVITYVARTTVGMWEQTDEGYGEIRYEMQGRRTMSRATTAEGVLEAIYDVAGVPPAVETDAPYPGHPLQASPRGARSILMVGWPALVLAGWWWFRRRTA